MKHKKSVLKILSANSECFSVSAGIAPNVEALAMVGNLEERYCEECYKQLNEI